LDADRLEDALHEEFMQWWPESEPAKTRSPETSTTNWTDFPNEPITHWLNVEDFLRERYPDAATGANYGVEEVGPLTDKLHLNRQMPPEELERRGYIGHGNVITQAMLNLHNKLQGRKWETDNDRRKYYELMLRHVGPDAVKRPKVAAVDQDMVDRLHSEFTDWYSTDGPAHLEQSIATSGWPEKTLRSMADRAMTERGPVGYWPNVEGFLKAKYPASHKNLFMGYEEARTLMDWEKTHAPDHSPGAVSLYETGPEAQATHGYDPKEIAAVMLLLHNKSDARRNDRSDPMVRKMDISGQDIDRLNEIAQKRSEMQQAFEQRAAASNRTVSLSPSADTDSIVYGLSSEFNDWAKANNKNNPHDDRFLAMPIEEYTKAVPRNWKPRGPVGYWPNVEEFMKERYPAAHRGLSMGFEDADPLLDSGGKHKDGTDLEWLVGKEPYETGPDAVAQHGYDPREIAATMLLLHNDTHPGRENYLKSDQARLLDIAQKRMEMQRAYEERQKVAATTYRIKGDDGKTHPIVDKIGKEFEDWATANGAENPNDHPDSLGYWGKPRGAIGYWPNVEEFLEEHYPEAHRGLEMGLEGATSLRDYGVPSGMVLPEPASTGDYEDTLNHRLPQVAEYETGLQTDMQYGYDPKEVVTALLLLHNQTHPHRWEQVNADQDVLMDIAQKRHKMQKAHDERMQRIERMKTDDAPEIQKAADVLRYAQQVLRIR
jgi:hypothetical protein